MEGRALVAWNDACRSNGVSGLMLRAAGGKFGGGVASESDGGSGGEAGRGRRRGEVCTNASEVRLGGTGGGRGGFESGGFWN